MKIIKKIIFLIIEMLNSTSIGRRLRELIFKKAFGNIIKIRHNETNLSFSAPNQWSLVRAETFSSKEPETLNWIDSFEDNFTFWDIGANLGLYSIYAGLAKKNLNIFSFEASFLNLELLSRNIFINNLQSKVAIIPLALSNKNEINNFYMSSLEWGSAESSFGENHGHDGNTLDVKFSYRMPSFDIDTIIKTLKLSDPNALKIDVDGIEHLILSGASKLLKSKSLRHILIEVNDEFNFQKKSIESILRKNKWELKNKFLVETNKSSNSFQNTYNQIWIKK